MINNSDIRVCCRLVRAEGGKKGREEGKQNTFHRVKHTNYKIELQDNHGTAL